MTPSGIQFTYRQNAENVNGNAPSGTVHVVQEDNVHEEISSGTVQHPTGTIQVPSGNIQIIQEEIVHGEDGETPHQNVYFQII